eukprot:5571063-Pyramimonas_sp.AAC.1
MSARCVATATNGDSGSLTLCSAHLDQCVIVAARKELLEKVARSLDAVHSTVIAGGDWNVCALGEARQHVAPSLDSASSGSLAKEFGGLFRRFTGLVQENHARCATRNGSL